MNDTMNFMIFVFNFHMPLVVKVEMVLVEHRYSLTSIYNV